MANWLRYKYEWIRAMDKANIHDDKTRRTLLAFWRRVNTITNMMGRSSLVYVEKSKQFDDAKRMAVNIGSTYLDEYNKTLKARGYPIDERGINIKFCWDEKSENNWLFLGSN